MRRLSFGTAGTLGLVAALLLVLALSHQNRELRRQLVDLRYRSIRPHAGLFVPAFRTATLSGDSVVVPDPENPEVLVLFSTTCPYCLASIPSWNKLARLLQQHGTALIGISLDSTKQTIDYVADHGLDFPVAFFPDEGYRYMYRANSVPALVVLSPEGSIVYSRMGVLTEESAKDSVASAVRSEMSRNQVRTKTNQPRAEAPTS